jgi:Superfamily I DNA and RNA helicases
MAKPPLKIDTLTHGEDTRKNAPTAELEAFVPPETKRPILVAYERRNPDLDPQLVWRGKDVADWSDLVVEAPPLYIQEKIHPKALIEDLKRASARKAEPEPMADLFADFNGISPEQRTEFYAHDQHWSNRMILGDGGIKAAELAVIVRDEGQLARARSAVRAAGADIPVIPMHDAKGLEYRACAVMAVDEDVLPDPERLEGVGDLADLEALQDAERHLLYVACTRARDRQWVSGIGPGSEFLDDLRMR